ncbi:hypothetical protein HDF11_002997 [Tunturiibacter psychrotolerans]
MPKFLYTSLYRQATVGGIPLVADPQVDQLNYHICSSVPLSRTVTLTPGN